MLTACETDDITVDPAQDLPDATPARRIELDAVDPLSKDCPDDVPCRVEYADLWFGEKPADLERAKNLCVACPVRLACLSGAIERREPWGVWGGEIFERGAVIARKRPAGRPRKDEQIADRRNKRCMTCGLTTPAPE